MTDADIRALIDDPIARDEVSAVELTAAFLNRLDGARDLHAMITITPELALSQAHESDHRRGHSDRLPLDGLPIVLKDNVDVGGVRTTVGSRLFCDGVPSADAEVTRRLRAAGAVILGKANMHELAFGGTSANETYGSVVNPWPLIGFPAVRAEARVRLSRPTCVSPRLARTPVARSGCLLPSAESPACGRATAPSPTAACTP